MTITTEIANTSKRFLKNQDGNWVERFAATAQEERSLREQGYKTAEDLWPGERVSKSKP